MLSIPFAQSPLRKWCHCCTELALKERAPHSWFAFPSPPAMTNKTEANCNPVIGIKELDKKRHQRRRSTHQPYKLQLKPTSYKASMAKVRNRSPSCSQHTWFLFVVYDGLTPTSMWALNSLVNNTGNWLTFLQSCTYKHLTRWDMARAQHLCCTVATKAHVTPWHSTWNLIWIGIWFILY